MKNDYYVYLHKTLNGDVFYVGKGRNKRAWEKSGRSKNWREVSENGYSIEIHSENLSESQALDIERALIISFPNLINKLQFTSVEFEDYGEHFVYDINSPSGLSRTKGVVADKGHQGERGKLGPCGFKIKRSNGSQYWAISFKNRTACIHRIIWQMFNGKIPQGFVIDHIDGNSLNNDLSNLRCVPTIRNARNKRKAETNSSGVNGVSLYVQKKTNYSYWFAYYNDLEGELKVKSFSVLKYGNEEAFRLACEYRAQKIRELNEQGAGYTERHGT